MKKAGLLLCAIAFLYIASCSKKSHPSKSASIIYNEDGVTGKSPESKSPINVPVVAPEKPLSPKVEKKLYPKTIFVNDAAAKKSVDGRLYYDVEGHRYWKNYKDGKYYLFNKSMYKNPDFKPPAKGNG